MLLVRRLDEPYSRLFAFAGYIDAVDEVGEFFVAAYMLFFGTLLLFFELMSFRKIEWIDHWFRRNCGFLYSALGKSLFIIL